MLSTENEAVHCADHTSIFTGGVGERIREEAFNGLKSLPRRGVEIGGFLTSTEKIHNAGAHVDGVEFVESEHRFGPAYRLSPSDIRALKEKVRLSLASGGKSLVGFFRTCTRDEFAVDLNDIEAIQEAMPSTRYIVLVRPFQNGSAAVHVFPFDGVEAGPCLWEFALAMPAPGQVVTAGAMPVEGPRRHPEETLSMSTSRPATARSEPNPGTRVDTRDKRWILAAALTALASLIVFVSAYWFSRSHARSHAETLGLRAETDGDNVRLSWNKNLKAFRTHDPGILKIEDGTERYELRLEPEQLASGSVSYIATTGKIKFDLEIPSKDGPGVDESLTLVGAVKQAPPSPVAATPEPPKIPPSNIPLKNQPPANSALSVTPAQPADSEDMVIPITRDYPVAPGSLAAYLPPRPIHRVTPEIAQEALSGRTNSSVVELQIRIDESGRVTQVQELGPAAGANRLMVARAVSATRQWRFEPAKSSGQNVSSDYNIIYRFPSVSK
jgi:TonB family protein